MLGPLVQNVVDWWYTGDGGDGGKVGPYQFWVGNGSSGSETDQTYIRSPTMIRHKGGKLHLYRSKDGDWIVGERYSV